MERYDGVVNILRKYIPEITNEDADALCAEIYHIAEEAVSDHEVDLQTQAAWAVDDE